MSAVMRNAPCPCGSGKRYKECCGRIADSAPAQPWNVVVLDDFFPNLLTGFRVAEFNAYLEAFPDLGILSANQQFEKLSAEYFAKYPSFQGRIRKFHDQTPLLKAKLAYVTFLANAYMFLPYLEYFKLPFVLQLYPGGGLGLYNKESDAKLDRICSSPLLRRIITTQTITDDYLHQRYGNKIRTDFIFGAVFDPDSVVPPAGERSYFGAGKDVLDVCFTAFKYVPRAADKGYPEFILAAHQIAAAAENVRFHVIGNLTPEDIDVSALGDRIRFHGSLHTPALRELFRGMDLIVSPNRPSGIYQGNFDGFPTGSVTEAALAGVGMMVSDPLELNAVFPENEAIAIVQPNEQSVADKLLHFLRNPEALAPMARLGQRISAETYAAKSQIAPRVAILREEAQRDRSAGALPAQTVRPARPGSAASAGRASQATGQSASETLAREISKVLAIMIPTDFGGGCPEDKALLMAELILSHGMKHTVEIGVYRGRSFIPQALAQRMTGGMAVGIDPYEQGAALENDAPLQLQGAIAAWAQETDFNEIHSDVRALIEWLDLSRHATLLRATSDDAAALVKSGIDMLHVDGNHDTPCVLRDLEHYLPLVRHGGYVIMDDIDWDSVAVCLERLERECDSVDVRAAWGVWKKR